MIELVELLEWIESIELIESIVLTEVTELTELTAPKLSVFGKKNRGFLVVRLLSRDHKTVRGGRTLKTCGKKCEPMWRSSERRSA